MSVRISEQFHLTSLEGSLGIASKMSDQITTSRYNSVTAVVSFTDIDTSINGTLVIEHSPDGTTWVIAKSEDFTLTDDKVIQAVCSPIMQFTRVVLTNTTNSATVTAAWAEAKS